MLKKQYEYYQYGLSATQIDPVGEKYVKDWKKAREEYLKALEPDPLKRRTFTDSLDLKLKH